MVTFTFPQMALAALGVLIAAQADSQIARVVPWNEGPLDDSSTSVQAYHPEPVLFVHGIAASRVRWEDVIAHLHSGSWFQPYHFRSNQVAAAKESTAAPQDDYTAQELSGNFPATEKNQWRDIERPYLHTFNYGRHAKRLPDRTTRPWTRVRPNRQTHDPLEWNAWAAPANDYLQGRVTLRDRLENPTDGIREAYRLPDQDSPNVLLISHSLGGMVVSEYLMTKHANLGADPYVPVRRSVAINSFFWGSPLANVLASFDDNWFNPYTDVLLENLLKAGSGIASLPLAVWVENRKGVNWQAITVDLEDAVAKGNIPPIQTTHFLSRGGPFRERIRSTPFPVTTEFVTSGSRLVDPDLLQSGARVLLGRDTAYHDIKTVFEGDGLLPFNTMAGYNSNGTPALMNLAPVDIRGYLVDIKACPSAINWFASHSDAPGKVGIYPHLLDGVQYVTGPRPERPGNWSGLQKQYPNSPVQTIADTTFVHTDEPGIADLRLLYQRGGNPLLVPAVNTRLVTNGAWQTVFTNAADFAGRQIIGGSGGLPVTLLGTTGVKNRSQTPVGFDGTNYWVEAGNEYLPASLRLVIGAGDGPIPELTEPSPDAESLVTHCLVWLTTNDVPQFQYGYFERADVPVEAGRNYIAVQGQNLAGLLTPQAERAFDVPVDSATVVAILRKINEAEALSNACHVPSATRWSQTVAEWMTVTNAPILLNFVPTSAAPAVFDAWTGVPYAEWIYNPTNNLLTFTNITTAPSQVLVSNLVYLGCAETFTNDHGKVVSNLTDDVLAAVPRLRKSLYRKASRRTRSTVVTDNLDLRGFGNRSHVKPRIFITEGLTERAPARARLGVLSRWALRGAYMWAR